jgi:predicted nucleic acid-binding protein
MYLIDTNVIIELHKKRGIDRAVSRFFREASKEDWELYISAITLGELRRGVELVRHRGDRVQASTLESWLDSICSEYANNILDFTATVAQVWGRLRVPRYENAIDKQIAATALTYGLTLVTRNARDLAGTGAQVLNPFADA